MSSQNDGVDSGQSLAMFVVFGLVALVVATVVGASVYYLGKKPVTAATPVSAVGAISTANNVNTINVANTVNTVSTVTTETAAAVTPAAAAPVSSTNAGNSAQNATDAASVKVENGVVKFYFGPGKSELAPGANSALADVIKGAQAGRKLVISGYHDATGSAAKNAELAKLRAVAVRNALLAAGVPENKIELKKPEVLLAAGSNAEARRVEVALE